MVQTYYQRIQLNNQLISFCLFSGGAEKTLSYTEVKLVNFCFLPSICNMSIQRLVFLNSLFILANDINNSICGFCGIINNILIRFQTT